MKTECLNGTYRVDFLPGSLHPVEQPALLHDLPQVVLIGVEQLLQENPIDISLHTYLDINKSTWKGAKASTVKSSRPMFWMH